MFNILYLWFVNGFYTFNVEDSKYGRYIYLNVYAVYRVAVYRVAVSCVSSNARGNRKTCWKGDWIVIEPATSSEYSMAYGLNLYESPGRSLNGTGKEEEEANSPDPETIVDQKRV
jgi:hypothetical protein